MAGRTLDAIIMDSLGLKEMTISRLLWEIEDLNAKLEEKDAATCPPPSAPESPPTP